MNTDTRPLVALSRRIEARPETIWEILTTPARFSTWLGAAAEFEPHAGSPFRAEFPQFETVIAGEIESVDPEARRLTLTWGVESGPQADEIPAGSTLLSISVHPADEGAVVELEHGGLPSLESAKEHEGGWRFHLSRLGHFANRSDLESVLGDTLGAWYRAWNETDPEARASALADCCAEDLTFKDEWAEARGVELLSLHIGNCQRFVPGWRIEGVGEPRTCRGEALVRWRSAGPGDADVEGHSHMRIGLDGRIRRVTGFPDA